MTEKDTLNRVRLRNLKRAKIKQLDCQLKLCLKEGSDNIRVGELLDEISKLEQEVENLK